MTVSKAKKSETLEILKADLQKASAFSLVQSNRITVAEVSTLRRTLIPLKGKMTVAKKTLIQLAVKEIKGVDLPEEMLPGQIAIVMAFDDAVAVMGAVNTHAKEFEGGDKLVFTGSFFEEKLQDAQTTQKLASLPSRDVLLAKFMGSLQSPVSALARFFDGARSKLTETGKATVGELVVTTVTASAPMEPAPASPAPEAPAPVAEEAPAETSAPEAPLAESTPVESASAEAPAETTESVEATPEPVAEESTQT